MEREVTCNVDLTFFPLETVLSASYRLIDRYAFRYGTPCKGRLPVTISTDRPDCALAEVEALYYRTLTHELVQRQAKEDHAKLHLAFTQAALALDIPGEVTAQAIGEQIVPMPAPPADAELPVLGKACENGCVTYVLPPDVPIAAVVRAISRLHDKADAVICEPNCAAGGVRLAVQLREGTDAAWWERRFAHLLVACRDGGLPALYVPEFQPHETEIKIPSGFADRWSGSITNV